MEKVILPLISAAALAALIATSAFAMAPGEPIDRDIASGLEHIRASGPDGKAMYEYIRKDAIPIEFADLAEGTAGTYHSRKRVKRGGEVVADESSIVLDESLRGRPEAIGETLYHEYIHRLQDRSGQLCDRTRPAHTEEGFDGALDHLGGELPWVSGDLGGTTVAKKRRDGFSRQPGAAPRLSGRSGGFSLRAFNTFSTGAATARGNRSVRGRRAMRGSRASTASRRHMRSVSGGRGLSSGGTVRSRAQRGRSRASQGRRFRSVR